MRPDVAPLRLPADLDPQPVRRGPDGDLGGCVHLHGEARGAIASAGEALKLWLLGRMVSMAVVGVLTWIGLIIPYLSFSLPRGGIVGVTAVQGALVPVADLALLITGKLFCLLGVLLTDPAAVLPMFSGVFMEKLVAFVKQRIGSVKAPKQVEIWPDLPRSKVGKVLKTEIKTRIAGETPG